MPQTFIKERLALLAPDYQEFLFGGYPEMTAGVFAPLFGLDEDGAIVLENGIVLFLLFFIDEAGLTRFLITDCHVEPQLADETVATILKGLPTSLRLAQAEVFKQLNTEDAAIDDTITESTRLAILQQSSLRKIKFYLYVHTGGKLITLCEHYQISDPVMVITFKELVGDIILGFYDIEDTVALLEQELELDHETATKLGDEVINFLAPLSNPIWQPQETAPTFILTKNDASINNDNKLSTEHEPTSDTTDSPTQITSLHPTPNFAIPRSLEIKREGQATTVAAIPDIHTMASDATLARSPERTSYEPVIVDEIIHVSSQPATRQSLSDLPAYTSSVPANIPTASPITAEPPRWGS